MSLLAPASPGEPTDAQLANMEHQLAQRLAQLESIYGLADALARATSIEQIHDAALDAVARALGTPRASILLADAQGVMRFVAWRGVSDAYRAAVEGHSPWSPHERDPRSVLVEDLAKADIEESLRATVLREGIHALAFVPLVRDGALLGKFMVYHSAPHAFTAAEVRLAETLASHVAMAIARERDRDELRRSESWLRAIFDSLDEALFVVSYPERRILSANPGAEKMLGFAPGELEGRGAESIHSDGVAYEDFGRMIQTSFERGEALHVEYRLRRKDGTVFPTHHSVTLLRSAPGEPRRLLSVVRDISKRKAAEVELEAARRQVALTEKLSALGTLVSGVAHEIRTPLAYVTNNLYLIQQRIDRAALADAPKAASLPELRRFAQDALEGVDRINRIVGELRRFTKMKAGERARLSLHDVASEAVELFRSTHRGSVSVVAELSETAPLRLDKVQLQQVVLNLLENAADAMRHHGAIRVTTRPLPDGGELRITDTGQGIAPHVQERMFDPLFTTKPDGTGLGLSITKRIVEEHGGSISYATRAGEGTTFVVSLPFA